MGREATGDAGGPAGGAPSRRSPEPAEPRAGGAPSRRSPEPVEACATLPPAALEEPSIDLDAVVRPILVPLAVVLAVAILALIVVVVLQARRLAALDRRLALITRGSNGASLEKVLGANLERMEIVGREVEGLSSRASSMEADLRTALQRVGFVRFNPFEETGGNQSFALALLDAQGNGFVISSLHARAGTRIYGKTLSGGRAETALSTEETEAVRIALSSARRGAG